ncbi:hypothetical protein [Acinetobacter shaoyimingii]|uniref:Uncharacterized protein n=1 Tax=Acinetobacter shaoyimingii TaxID=2715164 RepID=A0A6G8RT07_9GAMM|nr:hypothetical protein [Acinetobacter shaoyimingii]QIO05099.1 hypothetical protein G8E00_03500 [Acinetobacter shaoyimingii]
MLPTSVNIAISGLGIGITTELKSDLQKVFENKVLIHWTNISDPDAEILLINEIFFDQKNIQTIINTRNTPYLKITKDREKNNLEENILSVPIMHEGHIKNWFDRSLMQPRASDDQLLDSSSSAQSTDNQTGLLSPSFFTSLFNYDSGKLHLSDHLGTLSIIDHRGHFAWMPETRSNIETDISLHHSPASSIDFSQVSFKHQFNLEDWIFHLIWNSKNLINLPDENLYYQIQYFVQPMDIDRKSLLQLSASFSLGGQISEIANRLKLPVKFVQKFIAAHLAINNAFEKTEKQCQFGKKIVGQDDNEDTALISGFFSKLKKRFGF